jgi:hypothetical protein
MTVSNFIIEVNTQKHPSIKGPCQLGATIPQSGAAALASLSHGKSTLQYKTCCLHFVAVLPASSTLIIN